jgi:hypothetical protein
MNTKLSNMLFDHKPSGRDMLTSEGSKYFPVYLHCSLRIAGVERLRSARNERQVIHCHRNCMRLRFCFPRNKENTRDNECKCAQLPHQERIACPIFGTVSAELPKSQALWVNVFSRVQAGSSRPKETFDRKTL